MNIEQVFIDFVKTYPLTADLIDSPQTYALLDSPDSIDAANLGKTVKDNTKPYYYSRYWESKGHNPSELKHKYPLVAVYHSPSSIVDLSVLVRSMQVLFVYPYDRDKTYNSLVVLDLFKAMEKLASSFIYYLKERLSPSDYRSFKRLNSTIPLTNFRGGNDDLVGVELKISVPEEWCTPYTPREAVLSIEQGDKRL